MFVDGLFFSVQIGRINAAIVDTVEMLRGTVMRAWFSNSYIAFARPPAEVVETNRKKPGEAWSPKPHQNLIPVLEDESCNIPTFNKQE